VSVFFTTAFSLMRRLSGTTVAMDAFVYVRYYTSNDDAFLNALSSRAAHEGFDASAPVGVASAYPSCSASRLAARRA
jgi:hypothetical protein